jgi:hypothetical protein
MVTDLCAPQKCNKLLYKPFLDRRIAFFGCNQNITRAQHLCQVVIINSFMQPELFHLHFNIEHRRRTNNELLHVKNTCKAENYYCEKKLFIRPEIASRKKRALCFAF